MAEEGLWEPLVIIETGDAVTSGDERRAESGSVAFDHNGDGERALKEEEEEKEGATVCSQHHKQQPQATEEENKAEESKKTEEEESKNTTQQVGQTHEKETESLEDAGKVAGNQLREDTEFSASCEQQAEGRNSPEEDVKQVRGPFFLLTLIFHNIHDQEIQSRFPFFFSSAPRSYLRLFSGSSVNCGLPGGPL